tara:strand:+ start:70 stop:282 length:213 start_codon:yes stop_codon:yes gene_type:complete
MSKVKQYYYDDAEKKVDDIIVKLKSNSIDYETAKNDILAVENLELLNIDDENIDEVLTYELSDENFVTVH